jgi:hypothetical protein
MITLAAPSVTTSSSTFNGVVTTTVADTLFVSYVELGFASGTVTAMIQKGTMVEGVFTPNLPQIRVDVYSDGTFRSNDGLWSGTIPNWTATLASLRAPFDGLLLGSGLVTGTAV